jgi:hypothetical protein
MTHTLLSGGVGVPIALAALWLWFVVEVFNIRGQHRPGLLVPSAMVVTAVLLGIIVARFMTYT